MHHATLDISEQSFARALAWQQAAYDANSEFVVTHQDRADLESLRQNGYVSFCQQLQDMIDRSVWPNAVCFTVPKDSGGTRDALHISTFGKVAFLAVLLADEARYAMALAPYQGMVDYSRPLHSDAPANWFTQFTEPYAAFRLRTEQAQASGQPLILTDIAQCGPSCDIDRLHGLLNALGAAPARANFVSSCLKHWAALMGRDKGLPVGFSFSDLLLKLYLLPLDQTLASFTNGAGWRYADDIRITGDTLDARETNYTKVVTVLNTLGLTLNPAKERRLDATSTGNSDTPDTVDIFGQFIDPVWQGLRHNNDPQSAKNLETLPKRLLIALTNRYLTSTPDIHKTLFNFLINRVSQYNRDHDERHIMIAPQSLVTYVEHTPARLDQVLKYCRSFLPQTPQQQRRGSATTNAQERYQALYGALHTAGHALNSPYTHWQFLQSIGTPYAPAFATQWIESYTTHSQPHSLSALMQSEARHILKPAHCAVPAPQPAATP